MWPMINPTSVQSRKDLVVRTIHTVSENTLPILSWFISCLGVVNIRGCVITEQCIIFIWCYFNCTIYFFNCSSNYLVLWTGYFIFLIQRLWKGHPQLCTNLRAFIMSTIIKLTVHRSFATLLTQHTRLVIKSVVRII